MKTKKLFALSTTTLVLGERHTTTLRGLTKSELKKQMSTKLTLWAEQGVEFVVTTDWKD